MATRFKENAVQGLNERLRSLAKGQAEAFNVPIERIEPLIRAYGISSEQTVTSKPDQPTLKKPIRKRFNPETGKLEVVQ
jgi:hypothetical protein